MPRTLVLPLLLALAACTPSANQPTIRMAVGGQSQLVYLPATLAEQKGFYHNQGLSVALSDFPGGSKALEALLGGSADVVCGYFDHVIQMRAEGRKLKAFVTMQRYPGLALVVSPVTTRKIASIRDLEGAIVGVSSPGSSTDLFLKYLLSRHQSPTLSVIGIGMSAGSVAAMERGKVDAAIMADPAITILEKRAGKLLILADTRTEEGVHAAFGSTQYPAAVLYSTEGWLAKNQDAATRLARAIRDTLQFIQHKPDEVAAAMPAAFQGEDPALYARTVKAALPMYSTDGRMPPDGPALVQRVLSVSLEKVRSAQIDLIDTYVP